MKAIFLLPVVGLCAGCFSYQSRVQKPAVVETVTTAPTFVQSGETVVTTLPVGYRTRQYRGVTYYYTNDVVYRTHPRGGYVVVERRPW